MKIIIEPGKFYLKTQEDFVVDAVSFNPQRSDYVLFETNKLPKDILIGCYKIVGNEFILDQTKYQLYLDELQEYLKEGDAHV